MFSKLFANFSWRPQIGYQNIGRAVYERPFGLAAVNVNGNGGVSNFRSLGAFNPTTLAPQTVAKADILGLGNSGNANIETNPLNNATQQF